MKTGIYLAIKYMKEQWGRTFSLIIGIALAIMLIFSLEVIPETERRIEVSKAYETYGDFHVEYSNLNKETVDQLEKDDVRDRTHIYNLGSVVDKNGIKMLLNSTDEDYLNEYGYTLEKGNLPKSEDEIVLENKAIEAMGLGDKLNQSIDFTIEKEYKDENGENKVFSKKYSFKLVGIVSKSEEYYEEFKYHSLKAFTYYDGRGDTLLPNNLVKYGGTLCIGKSKAPQIGKIYELIGKYGLNELDFRGNEGLMETLSSHDTSVSTKFEISNKLLPMLTAILVIYNIFNIVLVDINKQIGTLKAIGASKLQVRFIVLFQSLAVLVIGSILGFLLGIAMSKLGLQMIYEENMKLSISNKSILEPIIMASITVLIASIIPIYKSGKISPMEAIRMSEKVSYKRKDRLYHKLIRKVYGLTGEMAYKNLWRNKVRTTLSILAMSLGGGLYVEKMAVYIDDTRHEQTSSILMSMGDVDINLVHDNYSIDKAIAGYTAEDINRISEIDEITNIEESSYLYGYLKPEIKNLGEDYLSYAKVSKEETSLETKLWLQGYEKDSIQEFDKYLKVGSTNLTKEQNQYPKVLVYNHFKGIDGTNEKQIIMDLKVGDLLDIKIPVVRDGIKIYEDMTLEVAGLLDRSWGKERELGNSTALQVIIPNEELQKVSNNDTYNKVALKIKDGTDKKVHKELEGIIKNEPLYEIESKYKHNQMFEEQEMKNKRVILLTVALILIISSLNILCTIKTNLMMRIKEFSTLRAIGMSTKKIKNMIMKESITYGVLGGIIGSISGTYSHYKFIKMINEINEKGFGTENTMAFEIPIIPIVQYLLVCIAICIVAVLLVKGRIEKLSIVEGLKDNE